MSEEYHTLYYIDKNKMKYEDSQLKRLQETELEILKEVIKVCDDLDITYFSVGGTTLGAIRHNGFIPWDDDIDIGMLRDDYEKFLKHAPNKLAEGYTLIHFIYEKNTPTYFAKIKKDGTKFVEKYARKIKMHQGVFIDIMPYDEIPDNELELKKYKRRVKIWNQLYIAKSVRTATFASTKHKRLLTCIRTILHTLLIPVSKEWLFICTDKAIRSFNGKGCNRVSSRAIPAFECKIEDLLPVRNHTFENLNIAIPCNAEKLLETQYGNYMQLPPEEKRYSHAPIELKL